MEREDRVKFEKENAEISALCDELAAGYKEIATLVSDGVLVTCDAAAVELLRVKNAMDRHENVMSIYKKWRKYNE